MGLAWSPDVLEFIALESDGDARRALGILEGASKLVGSGGTLSVEVATEAAQLRFAFYDKGGEEHYNLISALHKAVRGSDPDGALYWLARMVDGGEDPLYLARRLVRMASEDIGLSDPGALQVAVAARDAFHFLGSPEGELALAEATLYLATAPKSNRTYLAWKDALQAARETPGAPVPMQIRNAPTDLMGELGYGAGYRYDPDEPHGVAGQHYLPDLLRNRSFYRPGRFGHEEVIRKRLEWWARKREEAFKRIEFQEDASRGDARSPAPPPPREVKGPGSGEGEVG
jgi:putative ATPase